MKEIKNIITFLFSKIDKPRCEKFNFVSDYTDETWDSKRTFDFEICRNCIKNIFVDELLNHIECSYLGYSIYYDVEAHKYYCYFGSQNQRSK